MTRLGYRIRVGSWPSGVDLWQVNCKKGGELGHEWCGWYRKHRGPRFKCKCRIPRKEEKHNG